jgi:hypothetical protein
MPARPHNGSITGRARPIGSRAGGTSQFSPAGGAGQFNAAGPRIMAALATLFNVLALNLALLIASLPIVTLPAAVSAATVALDRWRGEGEDSVIREFISALRSRSFPRSTVVAGVPLAAVAVGVAEVHHFARGASLPDRVGLGFVAVALLITLTALGYVLLLAARDPAAPAADLWSLSARLAIRNLFVTGPLFLAEIAVVTVPAVIDPALLLLGLPLLLLQLMRLTAQFGLRRAERKR